MTDPTELLDVFQKMAPLWDKANTILQSEQMTLNQIKWGISAKEQQLDKLRETIRIEESRLQSVKDQAQAIVEEAKAEATIIKNKANQDRMDAAKLKADAKAFLDDTKKRTFMKESVSV